MMERLGMRIWNDAVRMHPVSIGSLYLELLRQFLFAACFKACISGGSVTGIYPFNAFGFVYVSLPWQDASKDGFAEASPLGHVQAWDRLA